MDKINPASGFIGALEVLEFVSVLIKQDRFALLTRDKCWHHLSLQDVSVLQLIASSRPYISL